MEIRIRTTGDVVNHAQFRALHPNTSFPPVLTEELLDGFDADPVLNGAMPNATRYQIIARDGVEQVNGKWYSKYVAVDMSEEAKAAHDAAQAAATRATRNNRLKDSDWSQGKDISDSVSTPWATYRQELRDVPQQSGFPWDVTWPAQPE